MNKIQKRQSREIASYTDLSDLRDIHYGEKCFVCGASPSIGFVDLSGIHDHVVISVNSSILLMDWDVGSGEKRYWISNDSLCLQWDYFWKHVLRAKCHKIVRTSWKKHDDKIEGHEFRYFKPRIREKAPLSNSGQELCSFSSVPTAIDLAILMGCKQIYLLGVDHKMVDGKSHFWQFWPEKKRPQRRDKGINFNPEQGHQIQRFKRNKYSYMALKELADRMCTQIYNCSTRTVINIFPKLSLENALK